MGSKVALLLIHDLLHQQDLPAHSFAQDIQLSLITNNPNPFYEKLGGEHWKDWVGSVAWNDLRYCQTIVQVTKQCDDANVQNDIDEKFRDDVRLLWYSLRLTLPIWTDAAFAVSGYLDQKSIHVNHYLKLDKWRHPEYQLYKGNSLNLKHIETWQALYRTLKSAWMQKCSNNRYDRLWRGIKCFQKACEESYATFRFPYFVRAVEALIIPAMMNTKKTFQTRPVKWWPNNKYPEIFKGCANDVLGEIYDIRSSLDHLHDLTIAEDMLILKSLQIQQIAREAYQTILLNPDQLRHFETDESIKKYWEVVSPDD